jgi:Cytochrome b subunit of the bc complex
MTMITPSYLGETIEYSSLHACRSTLEDPTDFIVLGYLGMQPATPGRTLVAQIGTIYYFLFFLAMPIYSKIDKTKPVPERVTK